MVLDSIKTGFFLYDAGVLFGVAPKMAWQGCYPVDSNNLCRLTMRCLMVRTEGKVILFDTGIGVKNADIMEECGFSGLTFWGEMLQPYGVKIEDVTDIVLSSLHFEHCGGCTHINYDQQIELTFPNATVHVSERQWLSLLNPSERERCMFIQADVMEVFKQEKLHVIKEDEYQICEGVNLKVVDANTKGQIVSYIENNGKTYVFAGDVIPTSANVPLDWLDAHDLYPVDALDTKNSLLKVAAEKGYAIVFAHDEGVDCATVSKTDDFQINEKIKL